MLVAEASCHKRINKQSSNNHSYEQSLKKITRILFYYKRYNNLK
jgi:hypothetical protein